MKNNKQTKSQQKLEVIRSLPSHDILSICTISILHLFAVIGVLFDFYPDSRFTILSSERIF